MPAKRRLGADTVLERDRFEPPGVGAYRDALLFRLLLDSLRLNTVPASRTGLP